MSLFRYQVRLARRSVARDARLSVVMIVSLGVAGSLWGFGLTHFLRHEGGAVELRAALYHVEIGRRDDPVLGVLRGTALDAIVYVPRVYVSHPEYQRLRAGAPARHAASLHASLWVQADSGPPEPQFARFCTPDFFTLFERPFRYGGPFMSGAGARPGVVLGHALNQRLFGGADSVGRTVLAEGRTFVVTGVIDGHPPYRPPWDPATAGLDGDGIYLPFELWRAIGAVPGPIHYPRPEVLDWDTLATSDARFVGFFVELPSAADRAAYRRHLERAFGPGQTNLRTLPEFLAAFPAPQTAVTFYFLVGWFLIVGGGFNVLRMLLAKNLARGAELGIHRALGARRGWIFWRQMLEGAHVAAAGAAVALLALLPLLSAHNLLVHEIDIPLMLSLESALLVIGVTFATGLLATLIPAWRASRIPPTLYLGKA